MSLAKYCLLIALCTLIAPTWCMELEQKPVDKIKLVRKHGLRWYLLSRNLPTEAVDRIMRYIIPEIPYACKLFWWQQVKFQKPTRHPNPQHISLPKLDMRRTENCWEYSDPNNATYIDALFNEYRIDKSTVKGALLISNKKFLAVIRDTNVPTCQQDEDCYPQDRISLYNIEENKEIRTSILLGNVLNFMFNPANTFILVHCIGDEYVWPNIGTTLFDSQTLNPIAYFKSNCYSAWFSENGTHVCSFHNKTTIDMHDLAPLHKIDNMCTNPTYEQAQLLLTCANNNTKELAKKHLMHMLHPETTTKEKRCVIS